LEEYCSSEDVEELADIAEVLYAIAEANGTSRDELERLRLTKREERGGFERKLLLVGVQN
ncbi:hypothetical protein P9426_23445, partial [Escherichia coli]